MTQKTVNIEVIADPVCPWCYVGKRRLDAALEQCADLSLNVSWKPYQLSPDMPREGIDRERYYDEKFGGIGVEQLFASVKEAGKELGIEFGHIAGAKTSNTLMAHVLLMLAEEQSADVQSQVAEKLFQAYQTDCENIGELDVLLRIAGEAGMDVERVQQLLNSGELEPKVQAKIQEAVSRGVTGVPFFVLDGQYGMSGAQPAEHLANAIRQVAATAGNSDS